METGRAGWHSVARESAGRGAREDERNGEKRSGEATKFRRGRATVGSAPENVPAAGLQRAGARRIPGVGGGEGWLQTGTVQNVLWGIRSATVRNADQGD